MEDKELQEIYQGLNFNDISFETFLKVNYLYEYASLIVPQNEIDKFHDLFKKFMGKFLSTKKEKDILDDLKVIRDHNQSTMIYFDYLIKTGKEELLSDNSIDYMIRDHLIPMYYVLYNERIVKKHEIALKKILLEDETGIEYWTNQFDFDKDDKYKYYLPKLTNDEMDYMICRYINSQYRNPNHLYALQTHKNTKDSYIIAPERFMDIEKAYKDCFNDSNIVSYKTNGPEIEMGLADDLGDIHFYYGWSENHIKYVSSKSFIDKNVDYDNYINILKYSLTLMDKFGRINGIYNSFNENELVLFENRPKTQYGGMIFQKTEPMRNYHFMNIAKYLNSINHSIEGYLEYVVNDIFFSKYGISGFNIRVSIAGDYKLKCEHLFSEMQGFVKQYESYLRLGYVSLELLKHLNFSSYSNINSKIIKKYYAVNSNGTIQRIFHLMFSYQSSLRHIDAGKNNEMSFLDLLLRYRIKKEEYRWPYSLKDLDFLVENNIIEESNGIVRIKNIETVSLLKELYEKGFVPHSYLKNTYQELCEAFVLKGWLKVESTLLSGLESDYFEYYLSDKKYSGNPAIRNKYGHGAVFVDENEASFDYYIGLRLFATLVLKIEEEFDLFKTNNSKEGNYDE